MKFITYAQNFEDVMLHRALRNIENGFYIDVGANDPTHESVTRVFYERGWSGVNIEPTDSMFARLCEARPRDVNLNLAAWRSSGTHPLFLVQESEAFATLEPAMAALHREAGRVVTETTIETISLRDVCERYAGNRDIHFMKVDVEGAELQVFQGHDFSRWRPWIILGEAHGPDLSVNVYQPWEDLLTGEKYEFIYCDGLNRFYVAAERRAELAHAFAVPPNVYDNWVRAEQVALLERAEHAERTRAVAWEELAAAQAMLETARHDLQRVHSSTSWRVTAGLRALGRMVGR